MVSSVLFGASFLTSLRLKKCDQVEIYESDFEIASFIYL